MLSPKWLVTLCANGRPAVSIAVAATATTAGLLGDKLGPFPGGTFFPVAIPLATGSPLPSAEDAAREAFRVTGRRVVEVPELVQPPLPYAPQLAHWRVTLEAPATLSDRRSGRRHAVGQVFVGYGQSWRNPQLRVSVADSSAPEPQIAVRSTGTAAAATNHQLAARLKPAFANVRRLVEAQ